MTTDHRSTDAERVDQDGLRVLWADTPGPATGAILFRTGKGDETLRTCGMNHLAEHMALYPIGRPVYSYNGRVEDSVTAFWAEGEPEEVHDFLRQVATNLGALPAERLETERRVLQTEAAGRGESFTGRLLALRYGHVGYGLWNAEELAVGWAGADDLQRWADERFTRENAVVWLSHEPPADFDLPLAHGRAIPARTPEPIPGLPLPAEMRQGTGGIALTAVLPRSSALAAGLGFVAERAHDVLRHEAGLSYAVGSSYLVLDGVHAHLVVHADCNDHDAAKVRDRMLSVLDDLAEHGPTEEELERDRRQMRKWQEDEQAVRGHLDTVARELLHGQPAMSRAELLREREELTSGAIAEALAATADSLLCLVPEGTTGRPARLRDYDDGPAKVPVSGTAYDPTPYWREQGLQQRLTVGRDGLTLAEDARGTDPLTIEFASVAGVIEHLSGRLVVVDRSLNWVGVSPVTYNRGLEAVERIVAAVGTDKVAPLTPREEELRPVVEQLGDQLQRVPGEVDGLLGLLAHDEELEVLAPATCGEANGLLVVTDRRVVFTSYGWPDSRFEAPRADVRAEKKGLRRKRLELTTPDGTHTLTGIEPVERLDALATMLG